MVVVVLLVLLLECRRILLGAAEYYRLDECSEGARHRKIDLSQCTCCSPIIAAAATLTNNISTKFATNPLGNVVR